MLEGDCTTGDVGVRKKVSHIVLVCVKKGMSKWSLPSCFCKAGVVNDQKSMLLAAFNFTTKIRQPAVG